MTGTGLARASDAWAQIALVPLRFGGWSCNQLVLEGDNRLRVRFIGEDPLDWVEVTVSPHGGPDREFRRLEHCSVRYRGALAVRSAERREEVAALVLAVGMSVDALLARSPGATIAEALGRSREQGRMVFGRDSLRAMLSPEIVEGVPLAGGFALADVYPSSYVDRAKGNSLELVLDFRRESDGRHLLLVVQRRDDTRPAFATTAHFSVTHLGSPDARLSGTDAVRALVAFVLNVRDHEGLAVEFPDVTADILPALLPEASPVDPAAAPEALNLAISAGCGQSCSFCSIQELFPPEDNGERALGRFLADLESNRRRGVRVVRINGFDPLAYSRILDVLGGAKALGYEEAHVFSPCTLLADAAFCDAVIASLPPRSRFFVPLYATRPDVHDRTVGRPGAHALVMQAIDHIALRLGPGAIAILLVATRGNLEDIAAVAGWSAERKFDFQAHMPFPSSESRADRYFTAAPRMTDVAGVIASAQERGERLTVEGVVPCVLFRRMRAGSIPLRAWLDVPDRPPSLPGTEYRDERIHHRARETDHSAFHVATVPCPHAAHCILATACPGELLRSYVEAFGLDELRPVSLKELVEASAG
jgi:hypothetical protein